MSERWQDLFWDHARRNTSLRMQSSAVAQTDLFGWLAPEGSPVRAKTDSVQPETRKGEETPRSRVAALEKPSPAVAIRKLRMAAAPARYADRRRAVNREEVVRLLEVTRGVLGIEGAREYLLPRGQFEARVAMWKGRPIGTPFVMERGVR